VNRRHIFSCKRRSFGALLLKKPSAYILLQEKLGRLLRKKRGTSFSEKERGTSFPAREEVSRHTFLARRVLKKKAPEGVSELLVTKRDSSLQEIVETLVRLLNEES